MKGTNKKIKNQKPPPKKQVNIYYRELLRREGLFREGRVDCVGRGGGGKVDNKREERKAKLGAKTKSHQ